MAEIQENSGKTNQRSRVATKIDMTPMVDLAFLLITFFMLTTTFSKPNMMELVMPNQTDKDDRMPVAQSRCLTILLDKFQKIYWYKGELPLNFYENPKGNLFLTNNIRQIIIEQTQQIKQITGKEAIVLIKPTNQSGFETLVDVLDEMYITNQQQYALVDISDAEIKALALLETAQ